MATTVRRRVDPPYRPSGSQSAPAQRKRGTTSANPSSATSAARGKTTSKPTTLTSTWQQAQGFLGNAGKRTTALPAVEQPKVKVPRGAAEQLNQPATSSEYPWNKRVSWGGSQLQAPRRAPTFSTPSSNTRFNKGTSARLIILAMGVAGFSIIFQGRNYKAPKGSKVPGSLHAFAGLTIAGTIALIVNELSPDLGMAFAVGLLFLAGKDIFGDPNQPGAFAQWGALVFNPNAVTPAGQNTTGGSTPFPTSGTTFPKGTTYDPKTGIIQVPGQPPVQGWTSTGPSIQP